MDGFYISLKILAIYKVRVFNSGKINMYTKSFKIHRHLVCVANIVISKNNIFNSRLLDPNQEHQALIPIVDHLEGGE